MIGSNGHNRRPPLTREERNEGIRPRTRGDCENGPRPCPFVSCRHHLLVDVTEDGRLKQNHSFDEDDEESIAETLQAMPETCALDVADDGGLFDEEVAQMLGLTRDAVVVVETRAKRRMRDSGLHLHREHPDDFYLRLMAKDGEGKKRR